MCGNVVLSVYGSEIKGKSAGILGANYFFRCVVLTI